ncbi:thioredoxin [Candidatus Blochmanniella vafra str. BVAF]|uniref:Thioredoxin n=1 Tax=Blochmanniella vafra (strain BVAF) TaxID=859654 RepID=E8Q6J4_BLOVB|nr:thioredoxin [Candidatus Blochmannia vafer]ADV33963.1 thioredoxin [Candidatus Blochmannia vafer str. BVAF]
MSQNILCLTDDNFSEYFSDSVNVKNNFLFLIDFWAEWCNPCKMLAPILEEIAVEFRGKIKVAKLNIDSNPIVTKKYNIRSIPTLLLIKNDTIVATKVGLMSKQQLCDFINTYVN